MKRNTKVNFFGRCRSVEDFIKICEIGEGAYGNVYKARDSRTDEIVALKQIKMTSDGDGMPVTAVREIQLLKAVSHHPNIVHLMEVVVGKNLTSVFLVFEYCQHDLSCLLDRSGDDGMGRQRARFSESQVKKLMLQLLSAIQFLHRRHIIHRDLKLSNLLYTNRGELKLADFGLARRQNTCDRCMSPKVVTLWYRSPELLFGLRQYNGYAVDMWAAGCILGELLLNQPLMPGDNDIDQLHQMVSLLGPPPPHLMQQFSKFPKGSLLQHLGRMRHDSPGAQGRGGRPPMMGPPGMRPDAPPGGEGPPPRRRAALADRLRKGFQNEESFRAGLDLMQRLLEYDPRRRIRVEDAINHPYFHAVHPKPAQFMPTFREDHHRLGGGM